MICFQTHHCDHPDLCAPGLLCDVELLQWHWLCHIWCWNFHTTGCWWFYLWKLYSVISCSYTEENVYISSIWYSMCFYMTFISSCWSPDCSYISKLGSDFIFSSNTLWHCLLIIENDFPQWFCKSPFLSWYILHLALSLDLSYTVRIICRVSCISRSASSTVFWSSSVFNIKSGLS